jgi:hypothetical protein
MLTRKNLNALTTFPLSPAFLTNFQKCCKSFEKLEEEYRTGVSDHKAWADALMKLGATLTQHIPLI